VVNATPELLYPWERPGTHYIGGWVGPRASLDRCRKSRLHQDSIPGPSRKEQYTDTGKSLNERFSAEQKEDTNTLLFKGREIGQYW